MKCPEVTCVYQLLLCWCGMWLATAESDQYCGSNRTFYTCPTDCSQLEKRVEGDSSIFNCTIGGIESIEKFKLYNPSCFRPDTEKIFGPPRLIDISFYRKNGKKNGNPSLIIHFLLPTGVKLKNKDKPVYPKAVLLKFQGIADPNYQDKFYTKCPRHRIFRFHHYNPLTTYDLYNPRNLTFDCLVGLSDDKVKNYPNVYKITLETVEGRSAIYTVTVNVFVTPESWNTVIATDYDEERKSIYVVFQKREREGEHVLGYLVLLQRVGQYDPVVRKLPAQNNTVLFTDVEPGLYYVNVSVRTNSCDKVPFCMNTTSYYIGSEALPDNNLKIILAVVLGCAIGIILILFLAYIIIIKKKQEEHKICGWLVHPFEEDADKLNVIEKFTEYLEETCMCSVRSFKPDNLTEATGENDLKKWCYNTLSKYAKFVIIALDKDAFDPNSTNSPMYFYSYVVKAAVERKKSHNNIRIFSVCFPFTEKCALPEVLQDTSPHYHMMEKSLEICEEICNFSETPSSNQPLINSESDKRRAVLEAIDNVSCRNQPACPNMLRNSNVVIKQTKLETKPTVQNAFYDQKKLLAELAKINEDTCMKGPNEQERGSISVQNGDLQHIQTSNSKTEAEALNDGCVQATEPKQYRIYSDNQTKLKGIQNISNQSDRMNTGCVTSEYTSSGDNTCIFVRHRDNSGGNVSHVDNTGGCVNHVDNNEGCVSHVDNTGGYVSHADDSEGYLTYGYVTGTYADGRGVINKPQSPQDSKKQVNKFDLDSANCPTLMQTSLSDRNKQNKPLSESEKKNKQGEHVELTDFNRGGKVAEYVTHDQALHWGNHPCKTHQVGYTGGTGNKQEHLFQVPNKHRHESRQQQGCHNAKSIGSKQSPELSPSLHAANVPQHQIHPSWIHRLGNKHQHNTPDIHAGQISQEHFEYVQGYGDAEISMKLGNQPLHNMDRLGDMHARHYYAGDPEQYVSAQGHHPNTPYGNQHLHQQFLGGHKCPNDSRIDDRQALANQNYVSYNEVDPGFYCESGGPEVRRLIDHSNIPYPEMDIYTDYIRPQCQRLNSHNSNRSDCVLSGDDNGEFETSYDIDPQYYITSDDMSKFESDKHSSGYHSSSLERQKPIGSSGTSIAVVTPDAMDAKSKNGKHADFLQALNVEGPLRKDYEMFEPIPPEEDHSPTGSINDVMEKMEQLNSR